MADLLDSDNGDEMRTRIKAAIRRVVKRAVCAFTHGNRKSVAVVRVEFISDTFREYVIVYEAGRSNGRVKRPGQLFVRSATTNVGHGLEINYDELAKEYLHEMTSQPDEA